MALLPSGSALIGHQFATAPSGVTYRHVSGNEWRIVTDDSDVIHTSGNETKNGNLSLVSNGYITTDTISFIGDSITDGAPGPSSVSKRYSTLTAGWVGLTEVNHGIGSSTMQKGTPVNPIGGVNMQDRLGDIPTKSSNNRVLVFEFGANDFGYNGGDYTPSNYKTAYRATLNNAISKGWETKDIYLLSPPYINTTGFAFYSGINGGNTPSLSRLTAYISATLEIAQEFNTNYLDLYSCMTNNGGDTLLSSDGVHPNDMGCRVISLFLSDQINRNFSPLYIYDDNNSTIGYFSNKGGLSNLKIGGINEQSLISPPSIELGGSYSTNANDFNNAKLKLCINGGGVWGLGVSASAGLEYFSATNKHTFYGNLDLKNQVNCEGNIFGLQFISSGMNAAYNYLDRSNNAKSWAMFADNSYTRWRSGIAPLVDLMILQETTGVLSVKGAPVGLTDVVRLNELSTYAPLASPSLTGTPTAPTATVGTSTTQLANTEFVGIANPWNVVGSDLKPKSTSNRLFIENTSTGGGAYIKSDSGTTATLISAGTSNPVLLLNTSGSNKFAEFFSSALKIELLNNGTINQYFGSGVKNSSFFGITQAESSTKFAYIDGNLGSIGFGPISANAVINADSLTAQRTFQMPDASGTVALRSDFSNGLTLTGVPTPTYSAGKLVYDTSNESLTFYNNDSNVALQIGQEDWVRVINTTGSTIANGAAVYINGSSAGLPTIALAQSNSGTTTVGLGLATESIANGATGYVTSLGLVRGLNTSGFAIGAVYISPTTPGGLTQTVPNGGNFRYRVGFVTSIDATNGTIHVTPSTAVRDNIVVTQNLNFPSTASNANSTLTATVTGAALGDTVILGIPNAAVVATNHNFMAWVSAANTVSVRLNNNSSTTAIDPAAADFVIRVIK